MALLAPRRSLRGRALQLLAQREQSRSELRRKLLAHALAEERALRGAGETPPSRPTTTPSGDTESEARVATAARAAARVESELDWLEANKHLSPERFVEARVHARSARFGNLRIHQELARHDLELPAETALALEESEFERACAVLARKFAAPPRDAAERARQARFLAGRGFGSEAIRRAVRAAGRVSGDSASEFDPVAEGLDETG